HVVTVHDVLELDDGSPVMVMDLLDGESLRERLDRGPLRSREAVTLADQLLSALEAAHQAGIVHRDLKPDNVFLARTDDGDIDARILDFGIAKLTAVYGPAAQTAGLTVTGMLVGTPHYMAPEQAFADPNLDGRVDLWAVGVIVYEALSGRRPIEGDNLGQLFRKLATLTAIPPLSEPGVPPAVADWVHRLLVDRERRFADAAAARRALTAASKGKMRLDDSVAPVALGDSADGLVSPRLPPPRSARAMATASIVAAAAVLGLATLRPTEPAAILSVSLASSWAPIALPTSTPKPEPSPTVALSATPTTEPAASTPRPIPPAKRPAPTATPEPDAPTPAPPNDGPGKLLTEPPF
ncbi:MAG: protein kinase, partial [Polyangiaceae bacterium]